MPDDVPKTLYAPEVIVSGGIVTDVSITLYIPEEAANVVSVDAVGAVGDEVWIVL